MARQNRSASVTVGSPVVAVVPAETTKSAKSKRAAKRREKALKTTDGKVIHGLTDVASVVAAGYTFAMPSTCFVNQHMFKTMADWYGFCSWRAEQEAGHYAGLQAEAIANPDKFKKSKREDRSAKLAAENAELEAKLARMETMYAELQAAMAAQPKS